jgi:valyl-tRNA synthetase
MKVLAARKQVAEDLKARDLMERIDEHYRHNVATCYRCGNVIEPLPRPQFFLKVKPLVKRALNALDAKETVIYGTGREKILRNWLENLKDWNISRQIVWGIRMPIWYQIEARSTKHESRVNDNITVGFLNTKKEFIKGKIGDLLRIYPFEEIEKGLQTLTAPLSAKYVVSRTKPGDGYLQDTDTFDTWFSSGQWPVIALKAGGIRDFERFYPTQVMETGYDILPIWVMRMMLLGLYLTDQSPFAQVYLHGLVRDERGQKMSKSKGNVIDPLLLVEKYGADALRMALVMSTTPGRDSAVGENKVKGMRNFSNKIWNSARFVKLAKNTQKPETSNQKNDKAYTFKLSRIALTVTKMLDELKIGLAAETVHNEFWHWWCDEVLESHKENATSYKFILEGMKVWLKLLHPFMPYVTEAAWAKLHANGSLLMTQKWPTLKVATDELHGRD